MTADMKHWDLPDEDATLDLARRLAATINGGLVIWLEGDLGAGKTTFARGLLRALGVAGRVKSPTYTLVEPYRLADGRSAWHLDLYRIADPAELEWLGLDDLADPQAVILVEWPERGAGALPQVDLQVQLQTRGNGRAVCMRGHTQRARASLHRLEPGTE